MAKDTKEKALAEAQRAQEKFEGAQHRLAEDGKARRESFRRAQKAGATLREIGEAAGLHWSSVADAIRKK
jgi:hypothetical protein